MDKKLELMMDAFSEAESLWRNHERLRSHLCKPKDYDKMLEQAIDALDSADALGADKYLIEELKEVVLRERECDGESFYGLVDDMYPYLYYLKG